MKNVHDRILEDAIQCATNAVTMLNRPNIANDLTLIYNASLQLQQSSHLLSQLFGMKSQGIINESL
jgi:hypothetical protein